MKSLCVGPMIVLLNVLPISIATAAVVTVSSEENWDGTANPHAADGVTLAGAGTVDDPAVYTIADGMTITSTGLILTGPTADKSIVFLFTKGNLQMDAGAVLNLARRTRSGRQTFTLDRGGGDLTGSGQVIGIGQSTDTPRVLTIQNVRNVTLAKIDLHVENLANAGRPLLIDATGTVIVTGIIDNSDRDLSGNPAGNVTIQAGSIIVGDIDTRALRTSGAQNGDVTLQALGSPEYDATLADRNGFRNKIVLSGLIQTAGPGTDGGNVTLQGVVLQFNSGFKLLRPEPAMLTLDVGLTRSGATDADLFIDRAASGLTANRIVQWSGEVPAGRAPAFSAAIISKPEAQQDRVGYSATLSTDASDPDNDPLTFLKLAGPGWLQIASNGALSGTPGVGDLGENVWLISVSDGARSDVASLKIRVLALGEIQLVTVTVEENWDGISNPHVGEGVTLSGSGTLEDRAIYTIPEGMRIAATGRILTGPSADRSIVFRFTKGNLEMESGAVINLARNNRNLRQTFLLDLGGGDIAGAGRIAGLIESDDTPRVLSIQNVRHVSLEAIDLHVENVNNSGRHLLITATGSVTVTGSIDNSDRDLGGNPAGNVTIQGAAITLGSIDTRAFRPSGATNGNVVLQALGPPEYDPALADRNGFTNKILLNGALRSAGPGTDGGNVTIQGVVIQFSPGFSLSQPEAAELNLKAGIARSGATENDLFIDGTGSGLTATHSVQWSGVPSIPPGQAPVFNADIITKPKAEEGVVYNASLAGDARDPNNDPITFLKASGPAWLQISLDGALSGSPALTDTGTNAWIVSVTDGTRFDVATLLIVVSGGPRFRSTTVTKPSAEQDKLYSASLAEDAFDPDNDVLSFAKVSGPDWLQVGSNGALSGTPAQADVGANSWIITVSDSSRTNQATLIIFVSGGPGFISDLIVKPNGRAGFDYGTLAASLALDAADPDNDPLSFSKVSGPAWLLVGGEGSLTGTPTSTDIGTNTWRVSVTDGIRSAATTLQIQVLAAVAEPTVVVVNSQENWDGIANPHAADGVTLSGIGTEDDPATYTIAAGMIITSTGNLLIGPDTDFSVRFMFTKGNLQMDSGAVINVARNSREGREVFVLDLGGGDITGAGRILGLIQSVNTPRVLTIQNVRNLSLVDIDLHVENVNNAGRHMLISANGAVIISGTINNSDIDAGGNPAANVKIQAESIEVGNIDTRALRPSPPMRNGDVVLQALGPPEFDPTLSERNSFRNKITLDGNLQTAGPGTDGGAVTLQGVVVQLNPGFSLSKPAPAPLLLEAGTVQSGAAASDLFTDLVGTGLTATHTVQWSGPVLIQPRIIVGVEPANIVIGWPSAASDFILEQSAALGPQAAWTRVTAMTEIVAGQNRVRLPPSGSAGFFRLRK